MLLEKEGSGFTRQALEAGKGAEVARVAAGDSGGHPGLALSLHGQANGLPPAQWRGGWCGWFLWAPGSSEHQRSGVGTWGEQCVHGNLAAATGVGVGGARGGRQQTWLSE